MSAVYGSEGKAALVDFILKKVWSACRERSDSEHRDALWQATALLISTTEFNRKLLHCIAWSQVRNYYVRHQVVSRITISGRTFHDGSHAQRRGVLAVAHHLQTRAGNPLPPGDGVRLELHRAKTHRFIFDFPALN